MSFTVLGFGGDYLHRSKNLKSVLQPMWFWKPLENDSRLGRGNSQVGRSEAGETLLRFAHGYKRRRGSEAIFCRTGPSVGCAVKRLPSPWHVTRCTSRVVEFA